jgi:hypothetical protein
LLRKPPFCFLLKQPPVVLKFKGEREKGKERGDYRGDRIGNRDRGYIFSLSIYNIFIYKIYLYIKYIYFLDLEYKITKRIILSIFS